MENHSIYPFVIFDDIFTDAGQSGPLAIVDGLNCAPFMRFKLADFATQSVRRDACKEIKLTNP